MTEQNKHNPAHSAGNEINHINLRALQQFECIGGECPSSCCRINWRIDIDADTLAAWRRLDEEAGGGLIAHAEHVDGAGCGHDVVTHNADGSCTLLGPDGLCRVQKQHGHDYLPRTCREFPRVSVDDGIVSLRSASLACPEVVRLALFTGQADDEPLFQTSFDSVFDVEQRVTEDAYANIKRATAGFLHKVMQQKAVPLNVRLFFFVGSFTHFHHQLEQQGFTPRLVDTHFRKRFYILSQIHRDYKAGNLQIHPVTAGSYWKRIAELVAGRVALEDVPQWSESPLMRLCAEGGEQTADFERIYAEIEKSRELCRRDSLQRYADLFENYLLLSFVNKGFPFNQAESNMLALLVQVLTSVAAVQLSIWALVSAGQPVDDALLQRIVYTVESYLGHSVTVMQSLREDPHMLKLERYAEVYLDLFD